MMTLEEAINLIDFEEMKNTGKDVRIKIKNSDWLESIDLEYCDSTCIYDKAGYTYCLNLKQIPFTNYPMRDRNYIQTYKQIKRMLNSLFSKVKSNIEIE